MSHSDLDARLVEQGGHLSVLLSLGLVTLVTGLCKPDGFVQE